MIKQIEDKLIELTLKHRLKKLKNKDFTLISNNCCGALIYRLLGLKYNTPTVNIIIDREYFYRFCCNLKEYCQIEMRQLNQDECKLKKYNLNAGIIKGNNNLSDLIVYFPHDKDEAKAIEKWNYRKQRINYNNIFIMLDSHMHIDEDDLYAFDEIPYYEKVMLVGKGQATGIQNAFELSCYKKGKNIASILCENYFKFPYIYSNIDEFDFVHWFNTSQIRINSKAVKSNN